MPKEPSFAEFQSQIHSALQRPLPGFEAQRAMAPRVKISREQLLKEAVNPRQASVLLLFYPSPNPHIVLIERAPEKGPHSRQIAFPGGEMEPHDHGPEATALRENEEEIGVPAAEVELLGPLSELYIPASHFLVRPFVGTISSRPVFRPDPAEVSAILEVPLSFFTRPGSTDIRPMTVSSGHRVEVPYFKPHGKVLWGATAMILSEFLTLIGRPPKI